jgi:hypothetical protein
MLNLAKFLIENGDVQKDSFLASVYLHLMGLDKDIGKLSCDLLVGSTGFESLNLIFFCKVSPEACNTYDKSRIIRDLILPQELRDSFFLSPRLINKGYLFQSKHRVGLPKHTPFAIHVFLNRDDLTSYVLENKLIPALKGMGLSIPSMLLLN